MPNYTTNYNLVKPLGTELYDIEVHNGNMDKIDNALANSGNAVNYSEVEEATGGTWFDGKPIYRVSKFYKNVTFAGTGQWTIVGTLPINVRSSEYNLIDFDMRLLASNIFTDGAKCASYRLPIMGNTGAISSPWVGDNNTINFNWANGVTKPFDSCDVLLTIYYTKN